MPRYPEGFSSAEFDELKALVAKLGEHGPFSANDMVAAYLEHRMAQQGGTLEGYNARPVNAGSVAAILEDLVDLEILTRLGHGTSYDKSLRFELRH